MIAKIWKGECTYWHSDQPTELLTDGGDPKTEAGAAANWILPPQT